MVKHEARCRNFCETFYFTREHSRFTISKRNWPEMNHFAITPPPPLPSPNPHSRKQAIINKNQNFSNIPKLIRTLFMVVSIAPKKVVRNYFLDQTFLCRNNFLFLFRSSTSAEAAMNLFINSNAQELLREMKPQLKDKLTVLLLNFMENLFSRVPFDEWVE